jgi:hypothetical protein
MPTGVSGRSWTGIEIQQDGTPGRTGKAILDRLEELGGDVSAFVREAIIDPPTAWRNFASRRPARDRGFAVGPRCADCVCYCYVIDAGARRLDVFATYTGASGDRIGSVWFDAEGRSTGDLSVFPRGWGAAELVA